MPGDIWDQAYGPLNMHVSGAGGNWCAAPGRACLKVKQHGGRRQPFCTFWEMWLSVSSDKLVTRKQFTVKSVAGGFKHSNIWLWLVLDRIIPFRFWFPAKCLFLQPKHKTIKSQVIRKYIKVRNFFNWQMTNSSLGERLRWLFFTFKWKECLENTHSGKFSLPVEREKGRQDWIGAIGHEVVTMRSWRQENKRGNEEKKRREPSRKARGRRGEGKDMWWLFKRCQGKLGCVCVRKRETILKYRNRARNYEDLLGIILGKLLHV